MVRTIDDYWLDQLHAGQITELPVGQSTVHEIKQQIVHVHSVPGASTDTLTFKATVSTT